MKSAKKLNGYYQKTKVNIDALSSEQKNAMFENALTDGPTIETYKGFELRTTENVPGNKHFTTIIFKNGTEVGATFAGPAENSDSVNKAKIKIDKGLYDNK